MCKDTYLFDISPLSALKNNFINSISTFIHTHRKLMKVIVQQTGRGIQAPAGFYSVTVNISHVKAHPVRLLHGRVIVDIATVTGTVAAYDTALYRPI